MTERKFLQPWEAIKSGICLNDRLDVCQYIRYDGKQESAHVAPMMMDYENPVDREINRIDAWLKATGMKDSRLGLLACANARAVERVRNGTGSVESLRLLLDYIDLHPIKRLTK